MWVEFSVFFKYREQVTTLFVTRSLAFYLMQVGCGMNVTHNWMVGDDAFDTWTEI